MQCPACNAANPQKNRFCGECGGPLERACSACGESAPGGARFCGACGAPLDGAEAKLEPSNAERLARYLPAALADKIRATGRIDGERRQVTVLFCDLADSTRLAEELGAEVYRELLDAYVEVASACIHRYEGVINQLAGDGFMAIFGAPIAHDDDAARACHAALDLTAELRILSRDWQDRAGASLAARIGLNTGSAIVGTVGSDLRMDYSAVGDTTNVASRIEAYAPPGEVYLSDATLKLVAHEFATEEVATQAFRGKREATRVHRLLRAVSRSERRHQALRGGLAPYLGRHTELAMLREGFEEAASGAGRVLFIGGEAGIGKSRLLHQFRRQLEPLPFTWVEGQCVSYGAGSSYLPIADLLRGFFEIEESDASAQVVEKISGRCVELGGRVKDAEPFYRDLLAVDPGDERLDRMNVTLREGFLFEAVRDLVLALAEREPVVLLVEDVHWIDAASERLLRRLFDALATARVLALVTHRSEYEWPHGDRSYFGRVRLRGLQTEQVEALAGSSVGRDRLPPALVRVIAERSDGNPFFVEEVVKALDEQGVLDADEIDERVIESVPATVQEVLLARMDRLAEPARRTLQIASVIGREFTLRVLERLANRREAPVALDDLRGLELIYEKAAYPELAYMFKHALTHDVAYQTLLESERRALHRTVAELIEELYAERLPEFYEILAFQYHRAEDPERGAHYALLSGERSAAQMAPEAETHFRHAARWSRGRDDSAKTFVRAQIGLGDHLLRHGHIDDAMGAYREALTVAGDEQTRRFLRNKLVERRFLERDGVRIAYYVLGEGADGDPSKTVPYVLLHPLIQGSVSFQDLAQRLCQQHCVIFMDPRGTGASGRREAGFDFETRVEDAIAMLEALPYERYVLQGDSDGVPMALRIYQAIPERVEALILFGFAAVQPLARDCPFELPPGFEEILEELLFKPDLHTVLDNFWNLMATEPGLSAWREVIVPHWEAAHDERTFKDFIQDTLHKDTRPLLPGVRVPTLVIAAEHDANQVEHVRYLAEHIEGARFALIRNASHFATFTAAGTYQKIVSTWLATGSLPQEEWDP